ncbi:Glycoprotease family [Musa troglodytarum]|nr:Glycoprotease family [Musa troglodytarum]
MTVNLPTKLRIRFPNPPLSSSSSDGDQRRQVLEDSRRPAAVDSRRSTRATFAGRKDACVADAHLRRFKENITYCSPVDSPCTNPGRAHGR